MRAPPTDPVVKEWRRLLMRIRRNGTSATVSHVLELVGSKRYPLYYSMRLIEYLLRRQDYANVEKLFNALTRIGTRHALIDKLRATYLWNIGKRKEAISYAIESAHHWFAPSLYFQASEFYSELGQKKKSDYLYTIAYQLAKAEEDLREGK